MSEIFSNAEYRSWFAELKQQIQTARQKAALALNASLIEVYWELGKNIVAKEKEASWGSAFIDTLSRDLGRAFPDMRGFSRRNLYAIRQWHLFYAVESTIVPQAVAQIPWGHNRLIISKVKNTEEALWYAQATIENGWSRDVLELKIEKNEYQRIGKC